MTTYTIDIRRAEVSDRVPLYRMLDLYQYDLSDIYPQEINAQGEYGYNLDRYWNDPVCHAFIATVDGFYAGFALVDARVKIGASGYWMDQFFILKKHRRAGVGSTLATKVFSTLPGHWEIGQMPANLDAQSFWRRVISKYTGGRYSEQLVTQGKSSWIVQTFECSDERDC
ncbi:MAG TPA: GNAT family N-acetyltransferase [Steroidobacteraceae bacterium]|jgi:predicted acetyltransferase|nr:GNAT family N-acetyltransferase [Steroidobacteraceae bacterium]